MKMKLLLTLILSIFGFANADSFKVYVDSSEVIFHENQILVNLGHGWIPVKEAVSEKGALYVSKFYSDPDDITPGTWVCGLCGQMNSITSKKCRNPNCASNKK